MRKLNRSLDGFVEGGSALQNADPAHPDEIARDSFAITWRGLAELRLLRASLA
jgi:hypothetical protein